MMLLMRLLLALCVIFAAPISEASLTPTVKSTGLSPAAPPRTCEIRQEAWCIYQDGSEITDRQKVSRDGPNDHIWSMRDIYHPKSLLVILEPSGCRKGFSDEVTALGFEEDVQWQGKAWDKMRIRLRVDGSCDLTLLVPLYDGDPLEWAFSVGRGLIAACGDDACTNITPTPADVTDIYRKQFRRERQE